MAYPKPAPDSLRIEHTPEGLRDWVAQRRRAGETIGLVPTMGALHEGHLSLVAALGAVVDRVVVSIFVNPTQFGPNEDFTRYPRQEAEDLAKLKSMGVDVAYLPTVDVMYPEGFTTTVSVKGPLTEVLEAEIRPGHFDGVATVVSKLLIQTNPDVAAFGEKDYQQLQVIRRMVKDLNMPIAILPVKTGRDTSGLALSSRNAYLSAEQRDVARTLNVILARAAGRLRAGATGADATELATEELLKAGFDSVDYVAFADPDTLQPLTRYEGKGRILAAARLGKTRLIDNMAVEIQQAAAVPTTAANAFLNVSGTAA
ncbi:MAG TPA: pantoate--beta-alanine ligase [Alphaproteobacteria bacterium]|nr:pantoate--beta-alanine ligase [Alphaproteobacteria bacterium]